MKIVSIDIGEKNFAFSIITVFPKKTQSIEGVENVILDLTELTVENIYFYDLLTDPSLKKKKPTIIDSCSKITHILETTPDIATCTVVLIEQQTQINIRAKNLAQHIWSYFHTKNLLADTSFSSTSSTSGDRQRAELNHLERGVPFKLIFVASSLKTKCFIKTPLTQAQRKKWTTDAVLKETIIKLAEQQHVKVKLPKHILDAIQNLNKKDDVCDTIVQAIAYLIKHGIKNK